MTEAIKETLIESMMTVTLNGKAREIDSNTSIAEAIGSWELLDQSFAIAVNEQFIPKSAYDSTHLQEGDRVELLVPMQGG